ncbi:MAG: site-specific integrase [Chloroflexota bacterium]
MINRENWRHVRNYLQYRSEVDRLSKASVYVNESWLRQLLEWAGSQPFEVASHIRPVFPEYVQSQELAGVYKIYVVSAARRFFVWLSKHEKKFSSLSVSWVDTLKLGKDVSGEEEHEAVTLEEVRAIASAPAETMLEKRIRASAVFWFLSGIRVGAFVTLPVSAVDLDSLTVKQWPKLGVHTKFKKHATTFLLDMPDLLAVVRDWDRVVKSAGVKYWFARVLPEGIFDVSEYNRGEHGDIRARQDLRAWLSRVGLPYHSPHKFRHGHATYALKQAKDVPALKAVSQNLMHSNLSVTDGIYAILDDLDVRKEIANLGKSAGVESKAELLSLLEQLKSLVQNG